MTMLTGILQILQIQKADKTASDLAKKKLPIILIGKCLNSVLTLLFL